MFNDQAKHVTKEEVENSYEFKLTKKILKREYPWIIDIVLPSDDEINEYALIFADVVIDPYILQRQTGWPFSTYMKYYFRGDKNFVNQSDQYLYRTSYLTTMFDVTREEVIPIQDNIEDTMKQVAKSPAIPSDLKLGKNRGIVVGQWEVPKMPMPDDAIFAQPD